MRELDGIHYAIVKADGQTWRVGALHEDWQNHFEEVLAGKLGGAWAAKATRINGKLAAMCCGLGSVWPGMGRGLYERFPAARAAMDYIASLADWDILALLDEQAPDRINQSRWQIPYLFMLEYAQWRQFRSLGLKPEVIFGHSLGELIALCLAGVYDARSAWLLLETRAQHMEDLEARSDKQGGMLAVPAEQAVIEEVLLKWPDLRISNRNTRKQFILSGNRANLLEARRFLRKKRIPAIMLNMDLAFHNPAMRILRDISIRRMNGLDMSPAQITMLSCVTARPYPGSREEICAAIADLDENTVDWVELISVARRKYNIRAWLELGPQETLCGITGELDPDSEFFAADRKSHEADAMAEACARLFAAGYLDQEAISRSCNAQKALAKYGRAFLPLYKPAPEKPDAQPLEIDSRELGTMLGLISEVSGKQDISFEMDLRRDLGLRSATFPFLMLEAENRLGRAIRLENLVQITTVADLVKFLASSGGFFRRSEKAVTRDEFRQARARIRRFYWHEGQLSQGMIDPASKIGINGSFELRLYDSLLKPKIESSLSALNSRIMPPATEPWRKISCDSSSLPVQAIIFSPPPLESSDTAHDVKALLALAERAAREKAILYVVQRFVIQEPSFDAGPWFGEMERILAPTGARHKFIACITPPFNQQNPDLGDLLNWELLAVSDLKYIVWDCRPGTESVQRFCPVFFDKVFPESEDISQADQTAFEYGCQFSDFSLPGLIEHGLDAPFSPLSQQDCYFPNAPWLPLGELVNAMCKAARLNTPWLKAAGFTDLRVFRFVAMPEGVTRECRILARPRLELPLGGARTRHCRVEMSIASLTPTGRKNGSWLPLCESIFLLCGEPPEPAPATRFYGYGERLPVETLFQALGLGPGWRVFRELRRLLWEDKSPGMEGVIELGDGVNFLLYDYAFMLAYAELGFRYGKDMDSIIAGLEKWRFHGIGFTRFDFSRARGVCRLLLRSSWRSPQLARFDIHIVAETGETVMAIHNLEFDAYVKA